eukprot:2046147-Prymnesium_polylepis.1
MLFARSASGALLECYVADYDRKKEGNGSTGGTGRNEAAQNAAREERERCCPTGAKPSAPRPISSTRAPRGCTPQGCR